MEIGLFQTGSSNTYAVEWYICEIPKLKPMFSGSPNPMELLPILPDTDKPEMEIGLFQTGSNNNYVVELDICEVSGSIDIRQ